ncbi:MAG TPA: PQQ-binding-like beta-propeller repeat protein [Rhizomicrobium sp.]
MKRTIFSALAFLCLAAPALAAPSLTLTATSGAPSVAVTLKGKGFDPATLVDVYFDLTDITLLVSNASGVVNATINIPASAQPGAHWLTLVERRNDAAAQAKFSVSTNWPQTGFGPSKRSFNPYENTVDTTNVAQLTRLWSMPLDGFGNAKPPIVFNGIVYVRDADQVIRAFAAAGGKLLWHASTPFEMFPDALTPIAVGKYVYFSDNNGNVIAYLGACRTDGGTCAPLWTTNIGSAVEGGLTFRQGNLYAPAADGEVHVLNPVTGAQGTPIVVSTTGALTSWIAFGADGGGYVADGSSMAETTNNVGSSSNDNYSGTLSAPVVGSHTAYATESDNILREVQFGWTAAIGSSSGCLSAPAFANGVVFASSCNSLGAYDAGSGTTLWSLSTPGPTEGLSVANGVLYACINSHLVAYAAAYGGRLWSGGFCSAAPLMVNGVLYASYADLSAYTLTGAQSTVVTMARPDPRRLKPTISAAQH